MATDPGARPDIPWLVAEDNIVAFRVRLVVTGSNFRPRYFAGEFRVGLGIVNDDEAEGDGERIGLAYCWARGRSRSSRASSRSS